MFLDFGAVWSHVSSFVTSQLQARGEKSIKSMELGEASVRLCVRIDVTAAHVTIQRLGGRGYIRLEGPLLTHCPFLQSNSQLLSLH